ncbi:MAG: phage holin family protein, partial [Chromatocurvus sp.]
MAANFDDERTFNRESRSIPQLIRDFTHEITALVRDEVNLARGEVSEKISQTGKGITRLGMGALVLFAGLLGLMDAAVVGLLPAMPPQQPWLAP